MQRLYAFEARAYKGIPTKVPGKWISETPILRLGFTFLFERQDEVLQRAYRVQVIDVTVVLPLRSPILHMDN
jgi:hypothetical protein